MIPPETYLGFHVLAILPPIAVLAVVTYLRQDTRWGRTPAIGLGIILVLAVVYTTPWDNLLIEVGVWGYGDGVTFAHIWAAPIGEYLFFVLQPILTALWLFNLDIPTHGDLRLSARARLAGVAAGVAVSAVGIAMLAAGPSMLYLGAILAWAGPILAIQWGFGWTHLVRAWKAVVVGIGVPTLYLWVADWYAISHGLWIISETYTTGIAPFGLPLEEAVFFLVTNVFVVQGLVLYLWLVDQWPTVAADVRTALPPALAELVPNDPALSGTDDRDVAAECE